MYDLSDMETDPKNWKLDSDIPHGSGDAEWRIVDAATGAIIAIIDPMMTMADPGEVGELIVRTMRARRG